MDSEGGSIYEQLVRCPVCRKRLQTPRTLPCRHTFCEECLGAAILRWPTSEEMGSEQEPQRRQTEDEVDKQTGHRRQSKSKTVRSFPCPVCEKDVIPRDPSKSVSHWANDFDTDDFTRRVLLALEVKEGARLCEVCAQRSHINPPTMATCWCRDCCQSICTDCAEIHTAFKTSNTHHLIVGLDQLQRESLGSLMPEPTCPSHERRSLEFYCTSCSKTTCFLCLKNSHTKCLGVITIKEKSMESQRKSRCNLNKIENQLKTKENDLNWIHSNIEELHSKKNELNEHVRKKTEELVKMLEDKANNFIQELETMIEAEVTEFQDILQSHERDIHSLKTSRDCITELLHSVSDADLISVSDEDERFLPQIENSSEISAVDITTDINQEFIESFEKMQSLPISQIKICKVDRLSAQNSKRFYQNLSPGDNKNQIRTERPFLLSVFKAHRPEEGEEQSLPSNVTFTTDGHIIVTDAKNIKVKKFTQQGELVAQISLASDPFCACSVNQKEIAVTLPYSQQIAFLRDRGKRLTLEHCISTRKKYASIALLQDGRFVCGSLAPKGIDVINQYGDLLSSFNKISTNKAQIQCPFFLSVISEKAILISDLGTNSLICCDLRGRVRFVHYGEGQFTLKCPRAVTHDSNGFIYVADEKADTVYRLLSDGSLYDILLSKIDGLENPHGLCITADTNKLVVTEGSTGFIKIYETPIPF